MSARCGARALDGPDPMAAKKSEQPRAWQRMLSGRRLDLLNPSPLDIEIEDIAHGLARMSRWNGQTVGDWPFSVAQHSLLVEGLLVDMKPQAPAAWRMAALLHDAPEYVIGDLISPFKAAVGLDYKAFELRLLSAIHIRFGLPAEQSVTLAKAIKRADQAAAFVEATQLAGFERMEAKRLFGAPPATIDKYHLTPTPTDAVKQDFLKRFDSINATLAEKTKLR